MERWKEIKGYEKLYFISDLGKVKNKHGKVLKQFINMHGYYMVTLSKKGKLKTISVHRLVAFHFVEGYSEKLVVNHKNENRKDNNFANLEWVTQKYNANYGNAQFKRERSKYRKVINLTTGKEFDSIKEAALYYGVGTRNIVDNCRGRQKSCGKIMINNHLTPMIWEYITS